MISVCWGSQIIILTPKSRIEALEAKVNHLLDECDASNGKCISTEPSGCKDLHEKASSTMPMVSRNSDISMLDNGRIESVPLLASQALT